MRVREAGNDRCLDKQEAHRFGGHSRCGHWVIELYERKCPAEVTPCIGRTAYVQSPYTRSPHRATTAWLPRFCYPSHLRRRRLRSVSNVPDLISHPKGDAGRRGQEQRLHSTAQSQDQVKVGCPAFPGQVICG